MLSLYRLLTVSAILFFGTNLQAQTCLPAPAGGDDCMSAPLMSCNLDGYVGTSGGYTPGPPPTDFCGLVENDQYFRFIADEDIIVIQIVPSNCTTAKGLQASIYETSDCVTLDPVSLCASFGFVNTLNVIVDPAVIGQEYYLLIDGFEGDVCDFTINVLRGILPDVEAEADNAELCIGNQITLDGTASTQRTNVEYYWTTTNGNIVSGANTMQPTIDAIGEYTLTVIDIASCCIDEVIVDVTENMATPSYNFDPAYAITCTNPTLSLDPNLSNATDYTFTWSTTDGLIDIGSPLDGESIVVSADGTYNLELEDNTTGCIFDVDVVVTLDNQDPDVQANSTNDIDCNNIETTINAQSLTASLQYSWEGPNMFVSNAESFLTSEAGTYNVTVTAPNGCTNTSSVVVSTTGNPDASISKQRDLDCINVDTRLTGSSITAGVTYTWTGPAGALGNMAEITVSDAGTYTLVVSLPSGCSTTVTEVVSEDVDLPNVSASASNDIDCTILNATLEGASTTMGANFSWTGPSGFTSPMAQPTVSIGGMYTLTVTGPNGCSDNISVMVNQNASAPIADAGANQMIDCNNSTVTIGGNTTSAGQEFTYAWTSDNAPGVLGMNSTLSVTAGGVYTLTVTNTLNNCTNISTVTVTEDLVNPTADAGGDAFLTCSMRSVVLGGASTTGTQYTYEWTDDNGNVVSNDATYTTTLIGDYTLTVTNTVSGCMDSDDVEVTEDPYNPIAAVDIPDNITCEFPTITVYSTGSSSGLGVEYAWYDNLDILVSTDQNAQIGNPGSYKLVVTDTNYGCADSIIIRVDEDIIPPLGSAGIDMNLDCSTNQVTLEASVSGDLTDFSFEWFDDLGNSIGNDYQLATTTPGRYDLIITDIVNGCTRESFATVNDNNIYPDADAGTPEIITCAIPQVQIGGTNSSTGSDIIYQWFDSSGDVVGNSPTIQVDAPDTYELVVTNAASSCSAQQSVVVSIDQVEPQAEAGTSALITCNDPTSMLDGGMSTASNGNLDYEWTDPDGVVISNIATASASSAGTYTLTVLDTQNGCSNSNTVIVDEDIVVPVVEVTNPEIINCYNNFVEVNYNSVNGPITPVWQDVNGTVLSTEESYLATQIGTVVLVATSQSNGCVSTASIDIIEDKVEPEATIAPPVTLTCTTTESELIPTITNFTTDATYSWTNNMGQVLGQEANLTVENDGMYTLEITNVENGCTSTFVSTVDQDIAPPTAVINNAENRIDCYQPAIDVDAMSSTGNAALTYEWTNSDGEILSDLMSFQLSEGGVITLEVTNQGNGCTDDVDVTIDEDLEAPEVNFNPVDKLTCTELTVEIESAVTGSNNSYAYAWEGPGNTGIVSGVNDANATVELIGDYTLTVVDQINGCESMAQVQVEEDRILPDIAIEPVAELNCITDQITIDASNSSTGTEYSYSWIGPSILVGNGTPAIEVDTEGEYNLLIRNTDTGCENTIDVTIVENTERPVGATLVMEDPSCFGERNGILDVNSVEGGTAPYLYAVNSETNFTDIATYNNLPAGDYKLIIQDDIGCEWDTLFQMTDPIEVTADLGADQVIRLGESSELFVQTTGNVISIAWSDNGIDGPIDVDYREIQPVTTTTYVVVVTNEEGCMGTDNVVVEVEDDQRVYFPNAFSPNGDGANDYFTVFADIATFEVSSLQIFDRWGNQVFEKSNFMPNIPELGWDGIYRGEEMPVGTYVYSAFIEFQNGNKINFKGEINIVY